MTKHINPDPWHIAHDIDKIRRLDDEIKQLQDQTAARAREVYGDTLQEIAKRLQAALTELHA